MEYFKYETKIIRARIMKIKIITDSTTCLPKEFVENENIGLLESKIMLDGREYKELTNLKREEFIESLQLLEPYPTTSLASPQDALNLFEQAIKDGYDEIFYIGLSPNVSNQFNSAKVAAKRAKNKIKVTLYQSGLMGPSQGVMVYKAVDLLKEGKSVEEIVDYLDELKTQVYTVGLSADFNTLFRTGKVKKGVGITIAASVLSLKPVFEINLEEGVVGIGGGAGYSGAMKKMREAMLGKTSEKTIYDLFVTDALAEKKRINEVVQMIRQALPIRKVHYWKLPPVITWAVGKGAIMATVTPV
ncbi:MAG: DegV family protein [Candidatus Heimdallarchaeaceae archaeon]